MVGPERSDVVVTPHMLPAAPTFVDRDAEVRRALGLINAAEGREEPCRIWFTGPPGIGTSTIAVHLGHLLTSRWPDGQLYATLGGTSAGGRVEPGTILESFLLHLGEPRERIPASTEDRAARYRTLTYPRRILVVLDDAADLRQVLALLPSSPLAVLLVTSSHRHALPVAYRIEEIGLEHFTDAYAMELLRQTIGPDRVDAEPEAARTFVAACAGLPRALELVSAKAGLRPHRSLAELAEPLRGSGTLEAFHVAGMARLDLPFEFCYAGLTPAQREALLLMSLHKGPDFGVWLAAAMLGRDPDQVRDLLDDLVDAHFLRTAGARRYRFDAFGHKYASRRVDTELAEERRIEAVKAAVRAQLAWAVRRAKAYSDRPCYGAEFDRLDAAYTGPGATARAAAELAVEQHNLRTAVIAAADVDLYAEAAQLCQALSRWLYDTGRTAELLETTAVAEKAAERTKDPRFILRMRLERGMAAEKYGDLETAIAAFRAAQLSAAGLGADQDRASAIEWEGIAEGQRGNRTRALECFDAARRIILGSTRDARTLALLDMHSGRILGETERAAAAFAPLDRAEQYFAAHDETLNLARTRHVRGLALKSLSRLAEARDAVAAARRTLHGTPFDEYLLRVVGSLAEIQAARDDTTAAVAAWRDAYELAAELRAGARQVEIARTIAEAYRRAGDSDAAQQWHQAGRDLAVAAGLTGLSGA